MHSTEPVQPSGEAQRGFPHIGNVGKRSSERHSDNDNPVGSVTLLSFRIGLIRAFRPHVPYLYMVVIHN